MPNGPDRQEQPDERNSQWGYGRTQPEFSLGERMATMEAEARKDNEFSKERLAHQQELRKVQIEAVKQEMNTKDTAQKEAIGKAEKAAAETATALATELRQTTGQTQTRLGALEVGGAGGVGAKQGSAEFAASQYAARAEHRAEKALQVSIAGGFLGFVGLIVAIIVALH